MAGSHSSSPDWDPMSMAHRDPIFNSYDGALGRNLQASGGGAVDKSKLYVRNIQPGISEDGLRTIFAVAGGANPLRVHMPRLREGFSKAQGFVEFKNPSEATNAIQALHGQGPMYLDVTYQRQKGETSGRPPRQMNHDTLAPRANVSPIKQEPVLSPRAGYYDPHGGAAGMNNLSPRSGNAVNLNISATSGSRTVSLGRGHFPPEPSLGPAVNGKLGSPRGVDCAAQAQRTKSSWSPPLLPCQMCLKPTADCCRLCKVTRYCSFDCSVKHWNAHKHTCMMICEPPGLLPAGEDNQGATVAVPTQVAPASIVPAAAAPVAVATMPQVPTPLPVQAAPVNKTITSILQSPVAPVVAVTRLPEARSLVAVQPQPVQTSALPIDSYEDILLGQDIEVTVADRDGSTAWVVVDSRNDSSYELGTAIKARIKELATVANPRIGDYVTADFCGDWYRACVVKVSPLTVFYVDYGNTEEIKLNQIRTLPTDFLNKPAQAIRISLMPSAMGTNRTFQENQQLVVCAVGKRDNITLVKLASDKHDTPAKTANAEMPKPKPDPSLDAVNMAGLSLAETPPAARVVEPQGEPAPLLPCQQFLQPLRKDQATKVYFVSKEGDNRYVQPISSAVMLGEMLKDLEQLDSASALKPCTAVLGQVVAAKFEEDWCRCKILSIDKNSLQVIYIDYGNMASISPGEIRELPEKYTHIPGQCVKVHFTDDTPPAVLQLGEFQVFSATLFAQAQNGSLIVRAAMN